MAQIINIPDDSVNDDLNEDLTSILPQSVIVAFPCYTGGSLRSDLELWPEEVFLSSVYDHFRGFNGSKYFHDTHEAKINDSGSGATAHATLDAAGHVATVVVDTQGDNYGIVPTVFFDGGGGAGAEATAVLTGAKVTSVTVDFGGLEYTSAPTVIIRATPDNESDLSALALQIATDYYTWIVEARLNVVLNGIISWPDDGLHDVEYCYNQDQVYTFIRRPSWQSDPAELLHGVEPPNNAGSGTVVIKIVSAAPTLRSAAAILNVNGTTGNVTKPGDWKANDVVLASITWEQVSASTATPPAGFTLIRNDTGTNTISQSVYWKKLLSTDTGPFTWSISSSAKFTVSMLAYHNTDASNPIQANSGAYSAANTTIIMPGLTTTVDNTTVVGFAAVENTDKATTETITHDGSMSSHANFAGITALDVADGVVAVAGATGNKVATYAPGGTFFTIGQLVALNPCSNQGGAANVYDAVIEKPVSGSLSFTDGSSIWAWAFMQQKLTAGNLYFAIPHGGSSYTAIAGCGGANQTRPLYDVIGGWDIGQGVCVPGGIQISTY